MAEHDHHHHNHDDTAHGTHGGGAMAAVKDPVCGMTVDPATAKHRHTHEGRDYYFCCAKCLGKFIADPAKYLAPASASIKDPVCGMTVDPHTAKHRHMHEGHPYYFCSAPLPREVHRRARQLSVARARAR